MRTFGRSTAAARALASSTVLAVSCASRGSTSIDTRPSWPPLASNTGRKTSHASRTSWVVRANTASSTVFPASASSRDLGVVGVPLGQGGLEDRRVGRDPDDAPGVDELLEVAGGEALARQVVEPDGDAVVGEVLQGGAGHRDSLPGRGRALAARGLRAGRRRCRCPCGTAGRSRSRTGPRCCCGPAARESLAALTTASGVNPNSRNRVFGVGRGTEVLDADACGRSRRRGRATPSPRPPRR